MSSPVSQLREDPPQETTPLLQPSLSDEEQPQDSDNESEPEESLSKHHRVLFIGTIISLVFAIIGITLLIVTTCMLIVGYPGYGFDEDWPYTQFVHRIAFASIAAIPLAVTNLVRLKRHGTPMPFMINIVFLGITGLAGLYLAFCAIVERIINTPYYCNNGLSTDPWFDGSYEECLHWKEIYAPLVFTWLAILCVYSLVQIVLFVHTGVDYYRTRSREGGPGPGSTLTFPVGGISVEFRINWGNRQNQTNERQSEADE